MKIKSIILILVINLFIFNASYALDEQLSEQQILETIFGVKYEIYQDGFATFQNPLSKSTSQYVTLTGGNPELIKDLGRQVIIKGNDINLKIANSYDGEIKFIEFTGEVISNNTKLELNKYSNKVTIKNGAITKLNDANIEKLCIKSNNNLITNDCTTNEIFIKDDSLNINFDDLSKYVVSTNYKKSKQKSITIGLNKSQINLKYSDNDIELNQNNIINSKAISELTKLDTNEKIIGNKIQGNLSWFNSSDKEITLKMSGNSLIMERTKNFKFYTTQNITYQERTYQNIDEFYNDYNIDTKLFSDCDSSCELYKIGCDTQNKNNDGQITIVLINDKKYLLVTNMLNKTTLFVNDNFFEKILLGKNQGNNSIKLIFLKNSKNYAQLDLMTNTVKLEGNFNDIKTKIVAIYNDKDQIFAKELSEGNDLTNIINKKNETKTTQTTECFGWPTGTGGPKNVDSCFGTAGSSFNGGINIATAGSAPVYSALSGTIVEIEPNGYDRYILIQHENGIYTRYVHVKSLSNLHIGDSVSKLQQIGNVIPANSDARSKLQDDEYGRMNIYIDRAMQEYNTWHSKSWTEKSKEAYPYLQKYWASTDYKGWTPSGTAWSAAFISYVVNGDFSCAGHWCYIYKIKIGQVPNWKFFYPEQTKVEIGDIVCNGRSGVTYAQLLMKNYKGGYKSHCDIVVDISDNIATTIGGNVMNKVDQKKLQLTNDGKLDLNGNVDYIAILKNLGMLSSQETYAKLHFQILLDPSTNDKGMKLNSISTNQICEGKTCSKPNAIIRLQEGDSKNLILVNPLCYYDSKDYKTSSSSCKNSYCSQYQEITSSDFSCGINQLEICNQGLTKTNPIQTGNIISENTEINGSENTYLDSLINDDSENEILDNTQDILDDPVSSVLELVNNILDNIGFNYFSDTKDVNQLATNFLSVTKDADASTNVQKLAVQTLTKINPSQQNNFLNQIQPSISGGTAQLS